MDRDNGAGIQDGGMLLLIAHIQCPGFCCMFLIFYEDSQVTILPQVTIFTS